MPSSAGPAIKKKNNYILAIAAKRINNVIMLVEARGVVKQPIPEDHLKITEVKFGDLCSFQLSRDNKTESLRKQKFHNPNIEVKIKDNGVSIWNVDAVLIDENGLKFYNSSEFRKIPCLDLTNTNYGPTVIYVRMLTEDERIGAFSGYQWGGISIPGPGKKVEKKELVSLSSLKISGDDEDDEPETERVTAIVVGKKSPTEFLVYALKENDGHNGTLVCNKAPFPTPGDWVSLEFTQSLYDTFFAGPKRMNRVPSFVAKKFRMAPAVYKSIAFQDKGIHIEFNLGVNKQHLSGSNITDTYLGIVCDRHRKIPDGKGEYRVTVRHSQPIPTKDGKFTGFEIIDAKKLNPETAQSAFGPKTLRRSFKAQSVKNVLQQKNVEGGESERYFASKQKKVAVVTGTTMSTGKNGKQFMSVYLWLLVEHECSKLYVTENFERYKPGVFFEGEFSKKRATDFWECTKFVRPHERLLHSVYHNNQLEFAVTVKNIEHTTSTTSFPKTYHKLLGKIIDNTRKLPTDCSKEIVIKTKQAQVDGKYCWVVSDVKNLPC